MRLRSACKSEVYNVMFAVFAVGAGLSRRQQSVLSGAEKLRSACATSRARPHDGVGFRTFSRSRLFFSCLLLHTPHASILETNEKVLCLPGPGRLVHCARVQFPPLGAGGVLSSQLFEQSAS